VTLTLKFLFGGDTQARVPNNKVQNGTPYFCGSDIR
jgi:hypothetical protein